MKRRSFAADAAAAKRLRKKAPRRENARRSDSENRKSHTLPNRALVDEQVSEVYALEHVVDLLLQEHPHRADAAALRLSASLLAHRMGDTVKVERAELGRGDDLAYRNLDGRPCEHVTTARAAGAVHQAGAPQSQENLLDVVRRQPLTGR